MQNNKLTVLFAHAGVTFVLLLAGAVVVLVNPSFEGTSFLYSWVFALLVVWCLWSASLVTGKVFDLYMIILLSMLLFTGGQFLVKLAHPARPIILRGPSDFAGVFPDSLLNHSTVYAFWGLMLFHLGGLLALAGKEGCTETAGEGAGESGLPALDVRTVGWALLLVSVVPQILIQSRAIDLVMHGSYKAIHMARAGMGYGSAFRILSRCIIPGSLLLLAASQKRALPVMAALAGIGGYVLAKFFGGVRCRRPGVSRVSLHIWAVN
jgi:hypothetical protein